MYYKIHRLKNKTLQIFFCPYIFLSQPPICVVYRMMTSQVNKIKSNNRDQIQNKKDFHRPKVEKFYHEPNIKFVNFSTI